MRRRDTRPANHSNAEGSTGNVRVGIGLQKAVVDAVGVFIQQYKKSRRIANTGRGQKLAVAWEMLLRSGLSANGLGECFGRYIGAKEHSSSSRSVDGP